MTAPVRSYPPRRRRRHLPILLLLLIAVAIGVLFEGACTLFERATHPRDFADSVEAYAEIYGVPREIVYATIRTESSFQSNAVSPRGAVGLMQILPDTFRWLGQRLGESPDVGLLYEPDTNIRYGTYYLSWLFARYGDWRLASAAYNAGHGRVDEWLKDPAYTDDNGNLVHIPFPETARYVEKVEKAAATYVRLYGL
jgi:soluble lytic murein transglycosylase